LCTASLPLSVKDPATAASYTLSLHDALPISHSLHLARLETSFSSRYFLPPERLPPNCRMNHRLLSTVSISTHQCSTALPEIPVRSEEHTSELQSRENLVCRLLLEKKKSEVGP